MEISKNRIREYQEVIDKAKVLYLIRKYMVKIPLQIKDSPGNYKAQVLKISDSGVIDILIPDGVEIGDEITLSAYIGKMIELDLKLHGQLGANVFQFQTLKSSIAKSDRKFSRFQMDTGSAFINNIKTRSNKLNINHYNIPTFIKIIMDTFKPTLGKGLNDKTCKVKIIPFDPSSFRHLWLKENLIPLFVRDCTQVTSYEFLRLNPVKDYIYTDSRIKILMNQYKQKKIRSEVLMPIFFDEDGRSNNIFGIVQVYSLKNILEETRIKEAGEIVKHVKEKIRKANTMTIIKRQNVLDIGKGGARFLINDKPLAEILATEEGFSFDLFFRMQAPINLFAGICYSHYERNSGMIIGVDFEGYSSNADIKRLNEIMESMGKSSLAKMA